MYVRGIVLQTKLLCSRGKNPHEVNENKPVDPFNIRLAYPWISRQGFVCVYVYMHVSVCACVLSS